jgi:hypothetical protein
MSSLSALGPTAHLTRRRRATTSGGRRACAAGWPAAEPPPRARGTAGSRVFSFFVEDLQLMSCQNSVIMVRPAAPPGQSGRNGHAGPAGRRGAIGSLVVARDRGSSRRKAFEGQPIDRLCHSLPARFCPLFHDRGSPAANSAAGDPRSFRGAQPGGAGRLSAMRSRW